MAEATVSANYDRWVAGFAAMPAEIAAVALGPWHTACDVMYDRSQSFVHVLSGRLKASGKPAEVRVSGPGEVEGRIEYDAPYAIYEFRRGGGHDALGRAFAETVKVFEAALPAAFERLVTSWR